MKEGFDLEIIISGGKGDEEILVWDNHIHSISNVYPGLLGVGSG